MPGKRPHLSPEKGAHRPVERAKQATDDASEPSAGELVLITLLSLTVLWGAWRLGVDSRAEAEAPVPQIPLRGTAQVEQSTSERYPRYVPQSALVRQADMLLKEDKPQAAEDLYQQALGKNSRDAGAWNGLGKVLSHKMGQRIVFQQSKSPQHLRERAQMIQHYRTALRYQPGYVEARLNLASIYMEQGRMADAADEISVAQEVSPSQADVLIKKGEWLVRSERYNEALPYLQRAVETDPGNAWGHYYLGIVFAERNQLEQALDQLNVALYQAPTNALAHYQLGVVQASLGNTLAAQQSYHKAIAIAPAFKEPREKLASYYERRGDFTAALEQLKDLYDRGDPTWPLTEHISRLSIANNQPEVAVHYYRRWLKEHPEDTQKTASALSNAETRLSQKRIRDFDLISQGQGKQAADEAIQHQPNNFEARMIQAHLSREIKSASASPPDWDPGFVDVALKQPSVEPSQAYEKGELLLTRYQFEKAEAAFRNARRIGEGSRNEIIFGELFLNKGLPKLAEESFRAVLEKNPEDASAQLGLGKAKRQQEESRQRLVNARLFAKRKSEQAAMTEAEAALCLDLKNAGAHYLLGQLYEKNKQYAKAADHYYAYQQTTSEAAKRSEAGKKVESLKKKIARQRGTL